MRATVVRACDGDELELQLEEHGNRVVKAPRAATLLRNPEWGSSGVDDMINLNYLHEPAILANLETRFKAGQPYTVSCREACTPVRF